MLLSSLADACPSVKLGRPGTLGISATTELIANGSFWFRNILIQGFRLSRSQDPSVGGLLRGGWDVGGKRGGGDACRASLGDAVVRFPAAGAEPDTST